VRLQKNSPKVSNPGAMKPGSMTLRLISLEAYKKIKIKGGSGNKNQLSPKK